MRSRLLGLAAVLAASAVSQPAGVELIRAGDMKADVVFLSSDDLAGRKTGTRENRIAADYIAAEFLRLGLKPAGAEGTFFQSYDLVSAVPDASALALTVRTNGLERSLQYNHDFELSWLPQTNNPATAEGPLLFLGYGIDAPEYGYSDLTGVDLHGRIVMILTHEPQESDANSRFHGKWNTLHAYDAVKYRAIQKAGAAGILVVREAKPHRPPDKPSGPHDWDLPGPVYQLAGNWFDLPVFGITEEAANGLLAESGKTVATLRAQIDGSYRPQSFAVNGVTVRLNKALKDRTVVAARNVAAVLEGSDPQRKDEYVVISAHYDHSGIVEGRLYRGADDNASGVAALLEIARAYVRGGVRPKRSILFLAFDSEEQGLLGSFAFGSQPLVPFGKIAANLNMDMIGRDEDTPTWPRPADGNRNHVNIAGTLYSHDLRAAIEEANTAIGLRLDFKTDTADPEEWFSRSDHFVFAEHAVPAVLFNTGEHPDYHTEHDTWDKLNYPKLERIARLVFATSIIEANAAARPVFRP